MKFNFRVATREDIPRALQLAESIYGDRFPADTVAAYDWLEARVYSLTSVVLLGEKAFGVACLSQAFYEESLGAYLLFLGATPDAKGEGIAIFRSLVAWARERNARRFILSSDLSRDFKPLLRRLREDFVVKELLEVSL